MSRKSSSQEERPFFGPLFAEIIAAKITTFETIVHPFVRALPPETFAMRFNTHFTFSGLSFRGMARQGNPGWASGFTIPKVPPRRSTEFEEHVRRLGLTEREFAGSIELYRWCDEHKDRCYIPEWLLKLWGMEAEPELSY